MARPLNDRQQAMLRALVDAGGQPLHTEGVANRIDGACSNEDVVRTGKQLKARGLVEMHGVKHGPKTWRSTKAGRELVEAQAEASQVRGVTAADIRRLIDWLDSEQDPNAYVTQFGVGERIGDFYVNITPGGPYQATATGGSVLIFKVHEDAATYHRKTSYQRELTNGITPAQRDELEALVTEIVPVHQAWNGLSTACETCSFHVAKDPGPGVARAYKNYSDRPGVPAPRGRPFVIGLDGKEG